MVERTSGLIDGYHRLLGAIIKNAITTILPCSSLKEINAIKSPHVKSEKTRAYNFIFTKQLDEYISTWGLSLCTANLRKITRQLMEKKLTIRQGADDEMF